MLYQLKEKEQKRQRKAQQTIKASQDLIDKIVKQIEPMDFLKYRINRGV